MKGIGKDTQAFQETNDSVYESDGTHPTYAIGSGMDWSDTNERYRVKGSAASGGYPQIYADLTEATALTVNQWRQTVVLQQMLELDARGGTRYVEILLARFGVVSPDFRLQRSEYLGGQTIDINVNPIA